jgi:hypothetical protein
MLNMSVLCYSARSHRGHHAPLCSSDTHSPSHGSAPTLCISCNYRHKATSRLYRQYMCYFTHCSCRLRSQLPNLFTTQLGSPLNIAHWRLQETYKVSSESLKGREHLADLRVDGRIILKWIKVWDMRVWAEPCTNQYNTTKYSYKKRHHNTTTHRLERNCEGTSFTDFGLN